MQVSATIALTSLSIFT